MLRFGRGPSDAEVRAAAWIARCVGRGERVPLRKSDLDALASYVSLRQLTSGDKLFDQGRPVPGVWVIQSGRVELAISDSRTRLLVQILRSGDVEGDIYVVLDQLPPYEGRVVEDGDCIFIERDAFERLLADNHSLARRWLTSCAARVTSSQGRILEFLSLTLPQKVARVLIDEAVEDHVSVPQRTLAAMLAIRRPSLNRALKQFEKQGMVAIGYAEIKILDRPGLERIASRGK